jgi:hypothetical protein
MDASRTGKRLAGKTALLITAVQGISAASALVIVKKISVFMVCLAFSESAFKTRQAYIIDGGCSD